MTWHSCRPGWADGMVPARECDMGHLVEGMSCRDAPTGPFSIIMASLIRYCNMKRAVELGTYKGGTTVFLAHAMSHTGGHVVGVEIDPSARAQTLEAVERHGLENHLTLLEGDSRSVDYDGTLIDLLFIDGNHTFEGAVADFARWAPWVRKGGWVFVDNAVSEPGVTRMLLCLADAPTHRREWQCLLCPESFGVAILRRREAPDREVLLARLEGRVL